MEPDLIVEMEKLRSRMERALATIIWQSEEIIRLRAENENLTKELQHDTSSRPTVSSPSA